MTDLTEIVSAAQLRALRDAGYIIVPREPTEVMKEAYDEAHSEAAVIYCNAAYAWSAMLAAHEGETL